MSDGDEDEDVNNQIFFIPTLYAHIEGELKLGEPEL